MGKYKIFVLRGTLFAILLGSVFTWINRVLNPKYFYNNDWPTTSTFLQFYEMDQNSIDILFLGSSYAVSAFSPQRLYDKYGLCSYNLSSEQQNLLISYYWLKEAMRYQKPKVVVLDTLLCFEYDTREALNSSEATTRKAIDYMRWSSNKREVIQDIGRIDSNQNIISYYFTNIRFHTRWRNLNEDDFYFKEMMSHENLKGYSALSNMAGNENYKTFDITNDPQKVEMVPLMLEYLNKIADLCESEKIKLVLVKTPYYANSLARYNTINQYAMERQLQYIDFNETELYKEIGYDYSKDIHNGGHANIWGATKLTDYIGNIIKTNYGIPAKKDEQWSSSSKYYEEALTNCNLHQVTDFHEYLNLLKQERYSVFMAISDEGTSYLDEKALSGLADLGITKSLKGEYRCSFYAVIDRSEVKDAIGYEKLERKGSIRKGLVSYEISSAGAECGNMCSIKIDGIEYAKLSRGINIVVYDNDLKKVIDSVVFDTCDENISVTR